MAEEKTIEQLQEELDMQKLHSKNLEELNETYKEIINQRAHSYDAEVERLKKEASGLNNTVTEVCRKNDRLEKEKADLQKKLDDTTKSLKDQKYFTDELEKSNDQLMSENRRENSRVRGHFYFDLDGDYLNLINGFLHGGYEVRAIPDKHELEITILQRKGE